MPPQKLEKLLESNAPTTPPNATKASKAQLEISKIDTTNLTAEQKRILQVFKGEIPSATIQGKDLNDLYTLESGSRQQGARKILIKHYGVEKTDGLNDNELLDMSSVIKNGEIDKNSFELKDDFVRYAYDLQNGNVKLRVVVDEFNDGKKIFDYYSDRNFTNYTEGYKPNLPTPKDITTTPTPSSKATEPKGHDLDRTLSGSYDKSNSTIKSPKRKPQPQSAANL